MVYVLYNPYAGNNQGEERTKKLSGIYSKGEAEYIDITKINDYPAFLEKITSDDKLLLCGGDGTLNRFINDTEGLEIKCEILHFPVGTGNDFSHELGLDEKKEPFVITSYLKNLPVVFVNGKRYRFLNGIGYGIDGYCCEVGDQLREISDKPINYTSIAIKGMLYKYKPTNAKVTVDGKSYTFKKAWLAPTMHGQYYGGGICPTPDQDRNQSKILSCMVMYGTGRLKTLAVFPSIFKGEHVKHTEMVEIMSGSEIVVEFDRPTALQVDGETILNVSSYRAISADYAAKSGE